MARQDGILPMKGTIDNITFYKSGDGYIARKKTSLDANRIAKDPVSERTRETGAEFTRAGQATKLLNGFCAVTSTAPATAGFPAALPGR